MSNSPDVMNIIEELRAERKALFARIVAANNELKKMPLEEVCYCGKCSAQMKVPLSVRRKEWVDSVRCALLGEF